MKGTEEKMHRRHFCRLSAAAAAAAALSGTRAVADVETPVVSPRTRRPNPYVTGDGKPIVVVVRGTDYAAMLARGMEVLGGFSLLGEGAVVLKPNLVLPIPWPYTTDPDSLVTVAAALRAEGFRRITVADWGGDMWSPGNDAPTGAIPFLGLDALAAQKKFKLKDLAGAPVAIVKDPRWRYMREVRLRQFIHKAPIIVSMPVLKQHNSVVLTAAVKNFVGTIDGFGRQMMHYGDNLPESQLYEHTLRAVAEVASAVNPDLSIIDARRIVADHHYDPAQGRILNCGRLIISGDMVAADLVADRIVGQKVSTYSRAEAAKLLSHVAELTGGPKSLDEVAVRNVRVK